MDKRKAVNFFIGIALFALLDTAAARQPSFHTLQESLSLPIVLMVYWWIMRPYI